MALLRTLAVATLGLLLSTAAQAATTYSIGTVAGNTGATLLDVNAVSNIVGGVANNTKLTLEFTLTGSALVYNFNTFEDVSVAATSGSKTASASTYSSPYSNSSLLLTTANIDNYKRATITITNLTGSTASFTASLSNLVAKLFSSLGNKAVTLSYSASAVPLPASFYMFGLALAGLAYAGSRRKSDGKIG